MTYILPPHTSSHRRKNTSKNKPKGAVSRASIALQTAPRRVRKTFKGRLRDLERHQKRYDRLSTIVDALSDEDLISACGRYVSALSAASKRIEEIDTDICKKVAEAQTACEAEDLKKKGGISDAQFDEDIDALCKIINQLKAEEEKQTSSIQQPHAKNGHNAAKLQ